MGMSKADRFPGVSRPGDEGRVPGSLDASPHEMWQPPDTSGPTSQYTMPAVPDGYDWTVACHGNQVSVSLRKEFTRTRTEWFQYSPDPYVVAALAVVTAESILRSVGPLRELDLSCLENFSPGVGVVGK